MLRKNRGREERRVGEKNAHPEQNMKDVDGGVAKWVVLGLKKKVMDVIGGVAKWVVPG